MTFRSRTLTGAAKRNRRGYREIYGVDPHYRHLFSRCNVGYLNVCGVRRAFDVLPNGELEIRGFAEIEVLKSRMVDASLYALAVSELRLPGSGAVDLGGGFLLVYQGSEVADLFCPLAQLAHGGMTDRALWANLQAEFYVSPCAWREMRAAGI